MYNNDYIMRMIEDLSTFLANVVFQKDLASVDIFDEQGNITASNLLHLQLVTMIDQGRINEAENLLFEKVSAHPNPVYLQVALDFYASLDKLSDAVLNQAGFPRSEIVEGLPTSKSFTKGSDIDPGRPSAMMAGRDFFMGRTEKNILKTPHGSHF